MNRTPVQSSNIRSVGYDPLSKILEVEFHGGVIYQYFNVPEGIFLAMISASSKGSYLHQNIKDRYHHKKVK
ncbi:KTSC domain-containing protein [bacterium]|nr:KTSC domain-containing protein [bacterium]